MDELVNNDALLSFLDVSAAISTKPQSVTLTVTPCPSQDPQWNMMQAQVMEAGTAGRTQVVPGSTNPSTSNSAGTFVDDMDVISPKVPQNACHANPKICSWWRPVTPVTTPSTREMAQGACLTPFCRLLQQDSTSNMFGGIAVVPAPVCVPEPVMAGLSSMMPVPAHDSMLAEMGGEAVSQQPRGRIQRSHRRSASAPAHVFNNVLGKRKPIKSPPPSQRTSSKSRAAKLTKARASGGDASDGRRSSFEDPILEEPISDGLQLNFCLKQGKEGSRDQGKRNSHPTWIRSNMRATWGHLAMKCESPEEAEALQGLLRDGQPYGDYAAASIEFEMLYDNGDQVELLEKKGGNLADRVKLILPNGNVEQGITMQDTVIAYHTAQGVGKQWVKSNYFQFDAARFPWNSDKKRAMEAEDAAVEIGLKFATNVTTRAHNKRRFMWKVDLRLYSIDGSELAHHTTSSPAFAYLPRNPEKSAQDFRLDDVVSDGHPGDLLMCGGSGLGCKERPQLVATLRGPKGVEYSLSRQSITKSTFVTRLPSGLPAGSYTVQLVNEDNPDEVTEEVKTKIYAEQVGNCFELAEFTQQLEAEALSRQGSGSSGDEDDNEMEL